MSEDMKNYYFWNEETFEKAIKDEVCPHCLYFRVGRECQDPDPAGCALYRYLPELVRIAQRTDCRDEKEFAQAVNQQMVFHCEHDESSGQPCHLMDTPRCGLDRLLPYVFHAVTETDKALEARPGF